MRKVWPGKRARQSCALRVWNALQIATRILRVTTISRSAFRTMRATGENGRHVGAVLLDTRIASGVDPARTCPANQRPRTQILVSTGHQPCSAASVLPAGVAVESFLGDRSVQAPARNLESGIEGVATPALPHCRHLEIGLRNDGVRRRRCKIRPVTPGDQYHIRLPKTASQRNRCQKSAATNSMRW